MPKKQMDTLTQPMYYTLLALLEPRCGIEITDFVMDLTNGRVRLGPGTLYTMLSKFESELMIRELHVDGRKRTYQITAKGRAMLDEEFKLLQMMVDEGKGIFIKGGNTNEVSH